MLVQVERKPEYLISESISYQQKSAHYSHQKKFEMGRLLAVLPHVRHSL